MPKVRLEPVRGMRDLIPPESSEILWLENAFHRRASLYGYEPVILPTVELFKLFEIKSGPEIVRSMYVFKDKAGRQVCLRPELTASAARLFLKTLQTRPRPVKIYYVGHAYRYEEPQRGRYREFIQAGVEYFGEEGVSADIELLTLIRDYLRDVSLKHYKLKLGHMGVLRALLNSWSIPEDVQDEVIHLIDKGLVEDAVRLLRKLVSEDVSVIEELSKCREEDPDALMRCGKDVGIGGDALMHVKELSKILRIAKELKVGEVYADLGFARGLAYYTGFIFEVESSALGLSVGGGGRYDTLISLYGGPSTPATGFALGIDRIHLALKMGGWCMPEKAVKVLLIPLTENYIYLDRLASRLRGEGAVVNVYPKPKVSAGLRYASSQGYDYAAIVGEREVSEGVVTVKNLRTRRQAVVSVDALSVGDLP